MIEMIVEYEINIDESYKKEDCIDKGGAALCLTDGDYGAEYNFCIFGELNCSAIYRTKFNKKTGLEERDYDYIEHYEIDFGDIEWRDKLKKALFDFATKEKN